MQLTDEERERYTTEDLQRQHHYLRLRQYCEELRGHPITDITITSLRHHYIVTGKANNVTFRETVHKSSAFLAQAQVLQIEFFTTAENVQTEQDEPFSLARCCGCDAVGHLGNLCTEPECLDSGNIYADRI